METKPVEKKSGSKKKKKKLKKFVIAGVVLAAAGVGGFFFLQGQKKEAAAAATSTVQTATVRRMNISSELSASSSLSPKDTYELTALVEGEVLEAPFEEGDVVEKGQVLYVIDATSMDSEVSSAETSLVRAQENLQSVQEEYNEAVSKVSGNTYKATKTGYIKSLLISEGDKVSNGTKIAEIYDDSVMKITVPFLSAEADQIAVGSEAIVTLEDSGEQLPGTVTIVSSLEEVLSGGRLVKAVTIEVANPGGLTTLTQATASVGAFVCGSEGNFTAKTEAVITADLSGNSGLEVGSMLVAEGSYVTKGTPLFTATSKSVKKYIDSFENSVESAKDSLKNAENKLTNTQDNMDNYTITAPISGTVITKNVKVGDNITKSSGGSSALAVIYDLSAMTLQMSVDELDVRSVKAGQEVTITADAIEGEVFSGTVTNVSLQSSYSQGVTNYPVTITMEETGDLLPGMNVDAEIILEESQNALVIPVGALMRGNRVYVKKDSASAEETSNNKEAERPSMPEGFSGGEMPAIPEDASTVQQNGVPEGFVAVRVETGIINDDYVEILSGLSEGDEVYVDPSAGTTTMNMFQMGGFPGGGMSGGMPSGMPGGNMGGNRGGSGMPSGMGGRP
ncbi:MAG: HlyD family efflux transporter periplasmic adaptor subunit [Lachnoclostridium sp.]|nr:HlyD family efflux transporter periplasmic adaptor subunit [Lachnoclostridium sp.]